MSEIGKIYNTISIDQRDIWNTINSKKRSALSLVLQLDNVNKQPSSNTYWLSIGLPATKQVGWIKYK